MADCNPPPPLILSTHSLFYIPFPSPFHLPSRTIEIPQLRTTVFLFSPYFNHHQNAFVGLWDLLTATLLRTKSCYKRHPVAKTRQARIVLFQELPSIGSIAIEGHVAVEPSAGRLAVCGCALLLLLPLSIKDTPLRSPPYLSDRSLLFLRHKLRHAIREPCRSTTPRHISTSLNPQSPPLAEKSPCLNPEQKTQSTVHPSKITRRWQTPLPTITTS